MLPGDPHPLAATFSALDLIDEFRSYVNPILLGYGHQAFAGPPSTSLALGETRTLGIGVVMLRYTHRQEPPR